MTKKQKEQINNSYSDNALKMMGKRYLWADDKGVKETPADMLERVSKDLATVEKQYGADAKAIKEFEKETSLRKIIGLKVYSLDNIEIGVIKDFYQKENMFSIKM